MYKWDDTRPDSNIMNEQVPYASSRYFLYPLSG